MNFGQMLEAIKQGKKARRKGWNGKGMFVYYIAGGDYKVQMDSIKDFADENGCVHYEPYLALKNVIGNINTWIPSISDILAVDWYEV